MSKKILKIFKRSLDKEQKVAFSILAKTEEIMPSEEHDFSDYINYEGLFNAFYYSLSGIQQDLFDELFTEKNTVNKEEETINPIYLMDKEDFQNPSFYPSIRNNFYSEIINNDLIISYKRGDGKVKDISVSQFPEREETGTKSNKEVEMDVMYVYDYMDEKIKRLYINRIISIQKSLD